MNLVVQRYNNFLNYAIAGVFLAEKTVGTEFVSPYMIIMKGQTMKNVWKTFGTLVVVIAVSATTTIAVLRYCNSLQLGNTGYPSRLRAFCIAASGRRD